MPLVSEDVGQHFIDNLRVTALQGARMVYRANFPEGGSRLSGDKTRAYNALLVMGSVYDSSRQGKRHPDLAPGLSNVEAFDRAMKEFALAVGMYSR